ncbi:MAG: prepilin peptidase [Magnetococcales bacterium]|nr:prepilin peptidase [Magnetococcales bacterium]
MSWSVVVGIYAAVVGSFLNVCIHRIPRGEGIALEPSHCPKCDAPIKWRDNIPILGWLLLLGRCRSCKAPISWRYPLVELLSVGLALMALFRFGLTWEFAALSIFGAALLTLTMIDFEHYILPDVITYPGMVVGVALAWLLPLGEPLPSGESSLIGLVVGGGGLWLFAWLFEKIAKKPGMGYGDVKLFAMIGAWLGWQALPFTIFVSALIGSVVGITWIVIAGRDRTLPIPFGPYLAMAAWLYLFWGPPVYAWYLKAWLGG